MVFAEAWLCSGFSPRLQGETKKLAFIRQVLQASIISCSISFIPHKIPLIYPSLLLPSHSADEETKTPRGDVNPLSSLSVEVARPGLRLQMPTFLCLTTL